MQKPNNYWYNRIGDKMKITDNIQDKILEDTTLGNFNDDLTVDVAYTIGQGFGTKLKETIKQLP